MKRSGNPQIYIEVKDTGKINAKLGDMHLYKDIAIGLLLIPILKNVFAAVLIAYLLIQIDCKIYQKTK